MAGIACGLVAIGTCNGEVTSTILQTMMERSETEVKETNARNLALGLGLTFLGKLCFLLIISFILLSDSYFFSLQIDQQHCTQYITISHYYNLMSASNHGVNFTLSSLY